MNERSRRCFLSEPLEARLLLAGEPWGGFPNLIKQSNAIGHYPNINGSGQSIAIIDTGVDYKHPSLGGGFGPGYKVIAGYDFVDNDADPMDQDGHGTGIAGIIGANDFVYNGNHYRGLAPKANIIALRAMDNNASDQAEDIRIEQALQWVIAHRTQYNIVAVNISDGTGEFSGATHQGPYWDEMQTLANQGVFIAAAAGNNGVQSPFAIEYPAADPNAYAIGSINSSDVISTFTERSADLDLLAPGENIPTTYYDPSTKKHIYVAATGTSFATPFAAAAAALLKQVDSSLSPSQIMDILASSGSPNYDGDKEKGAVTNMTFPRLDIDAAIGMAMRNGDDSFEENDSLSAAKTFAFSGDTAGADNLRLMAGDNDFYKFTLSSSARVEFFLDTTDGAHPTFELYSGSGSKIAALGSSATRDLAAGTYVLKVTAFSSTMSGSYSIEIDKTSDDVYESNNSASAATRISFSGGSAHLANLRLLAGNDDYYSFNLSGPSDVTISLGYDGNSSFPGATLLDSAQKSLGHLNQGGNSRSLSGGTYYIHFASSQTLDGTYSIDISATTSGPPPFSGTFNDMAVDASGRLHLAFYDTHSHNLEYVVRSASGVWSDVKIVDKSATSVTYVSLALDRKGIPGIAYYDAKNADLKYARLSGGTFSVTRIDSKGSVGESPSLAYTTANKPAISYYSRSGGNLKLATLGKSKWALSTIDSSGNTGKYTSLALNPKTGGWGIAYLNATTGTLRYAEKGKTGAWKFTNIEKIGGSSGFISLAFDSKARPAISYYVSGPADLHYAHFDGRKWTHQTVASNGTVGQYSSLMFDSSGVANIFFYNQSTNAPMLATAHKGSWLLSSIARGGGTFLSAAAGPGDAETFVYRDSASGTLLAGAV